MRPPAPLAQVLARSDSREVLVDDHDTILALEASNKRGVVEKLPAGLQVQDGAAQPLRAPRPEEAGA